MQSLENKVSLLDVRSPLPGKISATTKFTKRLLIRRLLTENSFTVRCHVINDRALVKENFAAESETFGGKRISLLDH